MMCVYKFKDDIPFNIHFIPSYSFADVISPFMAILHYPTCNVYIVYLSSSWNEME